MKRKLALLLAAFAIAAPARADEPPELAMPEPGEELSGGATTVFQDGQNAFSLPLANIGRENRRLHVVGNSFFNKPWVAAPASTAGRDGLGPLFHAVSCSACHTRDGRGAVPVDGELMTGLLFRLSVPGEGVHGSPKPHPVYGDQLAVRAIPGASPEGDVEIEYEEFAGRFGDGSPYRLRRPSYRLEPGEAYEADLDGIMLGPRLAPPVHGVGLLEAVPEEAILARADPDDADGDGISGRPNLVWDVVRKKTVLGRFGWKANQPNVRQQTAAAFVGDMGITSALFPGEAHTAAQRAVWKDVPESESPEVSDDILDKVVRYQQTLAPPARRNWNDPNVRRGQLLFAEAKCAACHVPKLATAADYGIAELAGQTIRPYTDLLLHDMGEDLADGRPDFQAGAAEWRTPPLWGLGLNRAVNGVENYLHDGRARTVEEAILWHGGEAEASREFYRELPAADRDALLDFLDSL
ncbi:MAG: di-heme oxidoredictase family protein [Verrucomicrobiales bacterium]